MFPKFNTLPIVEFLLHWNEFPVVGSSANQFLINYNTNKEQRFKTNNNSFFYARALYKVRNKGEQVGLIFLHVELRTY